jgi:hypothetical protein
MGFKILEFKFAVNIFFFFLCVLMVLQYINEKRIDFSLFSEEKANYFICFFKLVFILKNNAIYRNKEKK